MDLDSVTLDDALRRLTLPRTLGELDGELVTAQNGRYGPYVKKGADSRSLESEEQLFTVTLDEAKEMFAQPKPRGRAARAAAAPPLRELGTDPASGKPIVLREGRWGTYVTDGETNASLRKGDRRSRSPPSAPSSCWPSAGRPRPRRAARPPERPAPRGRRRSLRRPSRRLRSLWGRSRRPRNGGGSIGDRWPRATNPARRVGSYARHEGLSPHPGQPNSRRARRAARPADQRAGAAPAGERRASR